MSFPTSVAARISEALSALHRHPERSLLPWYRYAIYTALTADAGHGLRVRAWLDIVTVHHIQFCWRPRAWPATWPQPDQLLALAEQVLVGTADRAHVGALLNRASALADVAGEPETSFDYCAWCVFEAALRALHTAWIYDLYSPATATALPTIDVTGCRDDASNYAAIAVGGGTWHPIGAPVPDAAAPLGRWDWQTPEAQLRRAVFWEWWLRDAIPTAWHRG